MNNILRTILLACSVFVGGCLSPDQIQQYAAVEKVPPAMIQVRSLKMAKDTLTLDYRVCNPFKDDIRVCHSTWVHGKQGVQKATTRIDGETVWIRLRFNTEKNIAVFVNPPAIAKYVLLRPGESYSGKIPLDLPIRDYSREWQPYHEKGKQVKERKQVVLDRAVFEIGYLRTVGPNWSKLLDSESERLKTKAVKPRPRILGPFYYLPGNPFLTEEELDGQLREVMYLMEHTSLKQREEAAEVLFADVNIPCSVVVEEKLSH